MSSDMRRKSERDSGFKSQAVGVTRVAEQDETQKKTRQKIKIEQE